MSATSSRRRQIQKAQGTFKGALQKRVEKALAEKQEQEKQNQTTEQKES